MVDLCIVVAASENNVIGIDNTLPWKLSADLQHFKSVTMGHPLIMGRKTFESIGRPLPGRKTIVVTRQSDWSFDGVDVVNTIDDAIVLGKELAESAGKDKIMLVGGADLYRQCLSKCHFVYLTRVHTSLHGDAFFPDLDEREWETLNEEPHEADGNNSYAYTFSLLKRKM